MTIDEEVLADPTLWYSEHVRNGRSCSCQREQPDAKCDQGEALWRLRAAHRRVGIKV